jgi:hypothetical protein
VGSTPIRCELRLNGVLWSSSPCPSSLLGRTKFGGSDEFLGRIGINARARSDGLPLLLRAIDATQAHGYAVYFFTRLALKLLEGQQAEGRELTDLGGARWAARSSLDHKGQTGRKYSDQRSRSCEESAIASPCDKRWSCHIGSVCG